MAVAHRANTSSAWITVGHQSLDSARKRALDGCNLATRSGCYIADTHGSWGRAFVAMDAMGQLWIKAHDINYNDRHSRTRNQALAYCQQNSFGCENLADQQSGRMPLHPDPDISYVSDHFPEGPLTRNNWALVARPTKAPSAAWQNKSWLISGKQGSVATRKEILDRCQADSGVTCAISTYAVTDNALGGPKVGGQLVHLSIRPARTTGPVPCQRAQ